MLSLSEIEKQVDLELAYGIEEFELTGGEPSEHRQLREICQMIRKKRSDAKIAVITNGGLWKNDVWDLIDEVLVSYHTCKDDAKNNKEMFPLGSTIQKVLKTVQKAHERNLLLRTNTVCATFNLEVLDSIVDDIISFQPGIVNFLPVNLFDEAQKMCSFIDYNLLRATLKDQIDKLRFKIPSAEVNVRYMPFCAMEGYEQCIVGNLQHIYDKHDWNRELDGTQLLQMAENKDTTLKRLGTYGSTSVRVALETRDAQYEKCEECKFCKFNLLCDGVEKTYEHSLLKYCKPSFGKAEKNILKYFHD